MFSTFSNTLSQYTSKAELEESVVDQGFIDDKEEGGEAGSTKPDMICSSKEGEKEGNNLGEFAG